MSAILTSWKEIAQYVGKGVRTVQRWETDDGFPIKRAHHDKGRVVAFADEKDFWLHSGLAEVEALRQTVARLSAENHELRQQIASFKATRNKKSRQLKKKRSKLAGPNLTAGECRVTTVTDGYLSNSLRFQTENEVA